MRNGPDFVERPKSSHRFTILTQHQLFGHNRTNNSTRPYSFATHSPIHHHHMPTATTWTLSLRKLRSCFDRFELESYFHGQLYCTTEKLLNVVEGQRGGEGAKRRRQGEQVWVPSGSSMSLSRLFYYSSYNSLYNSRCQVPFLLPHSSPLSYVQEVLPLMSSSRGFSTFTDRQSGTDDSEGEVAGEIDNESEADPVEVERVCKVIDEVFALDRNMEAVLDECGVNLSIDLVVDVLHRFRHARKPAFRFFCWAGQKPGFDHDSRSYNVMLGILAKSRQFETVVSLLEEMGERGVLTMDSFTIAMRAFAAAKERKKAVGMFELMKKYKCDVGVETFSDLLDSLGRAKLAKEAQALFERLEYKYVPNLRTYTVLLNGWCRVKNLMEAGRVWNEMIDKGFKPDVVAHNVMLEGLLRSKKSSDAIKLLEVMKAKGPAPDVRSYTILIRYLCKQSKMKEAVEYFDEMDDAGCQPDAAVYTCLLTGFGNQKRMDVVCQLLKEMKAKGCEPDGKTYNALIKLMTSRRMPENAVRLYKKMIGSGIEPTIHTYNMIIKSFFQIRNYEMGHAVWDEMTRKGCCPDENSYTVLIGGLISQGRSEDACKYLEEMMEKGMRAPQLDYNRFAVESSRARNPYMLEELAQKMKSSGKFEVSNFFAKLAESSQKRFRRRDLVYPVNSPC